MIPQSFVNRYSQVFSPDDQQFVDRLFTPLEDFFFKRTVDLNADERRGRLKMGATAVDFSTQCLSEALGNPQICPSYLDVAEFKRDLEAMLYLREVKHRLVKLLDAIDDSMMLAGAEAYEAARLFYKAVQMAVAANQPGAAAVFDRLSLHFAKRANSGTRTVTSPPPSPAAPPAAEAEFDAGSAPAAGFEPPAFDE